MAALAITAPAGSATVPVIVPRSWANAAQAHSNIQTVNHSDFIRLFLGDIGLKAFLSPERSSGHSHLCWGTRTDQTFSKTIKKSLRNCLSSPIPSGLLFELSTPLYEPRSPKRGEPV